MFFLRERGNFAGVGARSQITNFRQSKVWRGWWLIEVDWCYDDDSQSGQLEGIGVAICYTFNQQIGFSVSSCEN